MRTRFVYQAEKKYYNHIATGLYKIGKTEGFLGLYKVIRNERFSIVGFITLFSECCSLHGFLLLYS